MSLINTGHFSPKPDDDEEELPFHVMSHSEEESLDQVEMKPDPLFLTQGQTRPNRKRELHNLSYVDDDNTCDMKRTRSEDELEYSTGISQRRGGRSRDPIWASFHNTGGNGWQCNDCTYKLNRPQADRMRKHRMKCQNLIGDDETQDSNDSKGGDDDKKIAINKTPATLSSKGLSPPASATHKAVHKGLSQFKTNSITRELKRIANALEEANKLKKLKLGLDPHVPFDGRYPN